MNLYIPFLKMVSCICGQNKTFQISMNRDLTVNQLG